MPFDPDAPGPDATPARVRLWTLHKDGRTATCDAQAHALGVELVSEVDGDVRRTEVARTPAGRPGARGRVAAGVHREGVDSMTDKVDQCYLAAWHEAGHVAMRWLLGWPLTAVRIDDNGEGFTEGAGGWVSPGENVLVTLAGYAAECGCRIEAIDRISFEATLTGPAGAGWHVLNDRQQAAQLVADLLAAEGRSTDSVPDRLWRELERTCDRLRPAVGLIEEVATLLDAEGHLSAEDVTALCLPYGREADTAERVTEHLPPSPPPAGEPVRQAVPTGTANQAGAQGGNRVGGCGHHRGVHVCPHNSTKSDR